MIAFPFGFEYLMGIYMVGFLQDLSEHVFQTVLTNGNISETVLKYDV